MLAISCAQAGGSQAVENIPERLKLFLSLPPARDCVFLLLKDSTIRSIRALLPHKQYTSSGVLFSFISSTSLSLPHASSCLVSKSRVRSLSLHYRACHLHQGCQETTRKRLFMLQNRRRKLHYAGINKGGEKESFVLATRSEACCQRSSVWRWFGWRAQRQKRNGGAHEKWIGNLHIFPLPCAIDTQKPVKSLEKRERRRGECFRSDILREHKSHKSQRRIILIEIQ